jgi:hypothetical protein
VANVEVGTISDEEEDDEIETDAQQGQLRKSTRQAMPHMPMNIGHEMSRGQSYMPHSCCGISEKMIEYDEDMAIVWAKIICELNDQQVNQILKVRTQNIITYMLNKVINKFGV